jgi:hypothetical protein
MFALRQLALASTRRTPVLVATTARPALAPVANRSFASFALTPGSELSLTTTTTIAPWWQSLRSFVDDGLWLISTMKRRNKMMNKHKLRKRRKKNRMKSKK